METTEITLDRGLPLFTKESGDCLKATGKVLTAGSVIRIGEMDLAYHESEVVEVYQILELDGYYILESHLFPESNLVRVGREFKEATVH